jgi:formylglycine-generating enzyme required for sulfatase activity
LIAARTLLAIAWLPLAGWAGGGDYAVVPAGTFVSALKYEDAGQMQLAPFRMMKRPVTNAEFLAFVEAHPEWRRDRVAPVFAGPGYLGHWPTATGLSAEQRAQPVTRVSWFAATAYCTSKGARLPRWSEWEYAAAADATHRDARRDPAWRERILSWYARPASSKLPRAGAQPPNVYGVGDLHGVVWEWVDDYSALLVIGDSRNQGDAERNRFCGAGALSLDDRENYAVLMRVALLSSLEGADSTTSLGFRCVQEVQ